MDRPQLIIGSLVTTLVVAGSAWWVLQEPPLDSTWVDDHFPPASSYDNDRAVGNSFSAWQADYGDLDIVQNQLRDAAWTTDGISDLLVRLDLTVTHQDTAGDARPLFPSSRADDAARVVSRSLAALSDRDDLTDLREDLATEASGAGSAAIAHTMSVWGLAFIVSPTVSSSYPIPGSYGPTLDALGTTSSAPLVSADWSNNAADLATASDQGFGILVTDMPDVVRRGLTSSRAVDSVADGPRRSRTGNNFADDAVQSWAAIGHAISSDPTRSTAERGRRLALWVDILGQQADDIDTVATPRRGTDDQPVPFAIPTNGAVVSTLPTTELSAIDRDEAVEQLIRARVLLNVRVLEQAESWDERPAGLTIPSWSDASSLEDQAWEQAVREWQSGTSIDLSSPNVDRELGRALDEGQR